ncbi:chemotaxis-specific protein-glutamate methyltransferase CheB [Cellulomonas citrea]|uniref:chemotaxis-specific protein-glutamate methyltransferase CheB n=1 Tax=Cellulomonas citrea TaxID=1909423 RepID=UPI00135CD3FF|nr:chemotaxis-specific protein-glutamate methyltransferase CheB [Cellulomonas citrea]
MTAIRVLVVDDSVVVRRLVTEVLDSDPQIEVVGTASTGLIAQSRAAQLGPDLVTMDIEMPDMDGIEAVRTLRKAGHRMPIIMFSTLTERGAAATLEALAAGATDYVTKPTNTGGLAASKQQVADNLIPKVKALVGARRPAARATSTSPVATAAPKAARAFTLRSEPPARPVHALIVGSSTGGPEALSRFFEGLHQAPPVPVLVTQHMPPVFTRQLAARLDRLGPTRVVEATGAETLEPGHAYIAAGDHHLELRRQGTSVKTVLTDGPPVNFCRPSVDVMFRSAVQVLGGNLLAVVLTGMGADGRTGCADLISAGGTVYVQDEATSVVWGMPGAVATAGLAHRVLPLTEIAPAVERRLHGVLTSGGPR